MKRTEFGRQKWRRGLFLFLFLLILLPLGERNGSVARFEED
jgi:hypothetical protein